MGEENNMGAFSLANGINKPYQLSTERARSSGRVLVSFINFVFLHKLFYLLIPLSSLFS